MLAVKHLFVQWSFPVVCLLVLINLIWGIAKKRSRFSFVLWIRRAIALVVLVNIIRWMIIIEVI